MGFGLGSVASAGAGLKGAAVGAAASAAKASPLGGAFSLLAGGKDKSKGNEIQLQKAVITNTATGESLTVAFNPSEYVLSREAVYTERSALYENSSSVEFSNLRRRQMEVTLFFDTKHAFAITTPNGVQVLVHVGLDTVLMNGRGITALHHTGDQVKAGDPILQLDLDLLKKKHINLISPVLIVNYDRVRHLRPRVAGCEVSAGMDTVLDYAV